MTDARQHLGRTGEDLATQLLQKNHYKILGRNIKLPFGEIDILAQEKKTIVLVEVKTKRGRLFGLPQDMVHAHKQHKLRQLAGWLTQQYPEQVIRVDVVAVDLENPALPSIEHLENVLDC